jgi:hypothetical protein
MKQMETISGHMKKPSEGFLKYCIIFGMNTGFLYDGARARILMLAVVSWLASRHEAESGSSRFHIK